MALSKDTEIYRTAYNLLLCVSPMINSMPRGYRYDLGKRITDTLLDVLVLIIEANMAADKTDKLTQLQTKHQILVMLTSAAVDLQALSRKQFARLLPLLDSVGRQTNGWKRYAERQSPANGQ